MTGFLFSFLFCGLIVLGAIVLWAVRFFFWTQRSLRKPEPGFEFVYVNQDGSVREVSPNERSYLGEKFSPADGARPYFKSSFSTRDGWGSLSGFIERRLVPAGVTILPVHPDFDTAYAAQKVDFLKLDRAAGRIVTNNPDGSVTSAPDPTLPRREAFERSRQVHLDHQRRLEALAKIKEP